MFKFYTNFFWHQYHRFIVFWSVHLIIAHEYSHRWFWSRVIWNLFHPGPKNSVFTANKWILDDNRNFGKFQYWPLSIYKLSTPQDMIRQSRPVTGTLTVAIIGRCPDLVFTQPTDFMFLADPKPEYLNFRLS